MIEANLDSVLSFARTRPRQLALADLESGRRWTYAELDRAADGVAAWLVARLGPASGARVAVIARNCAETMLLHLGAIRAGAVFVPFNWRLAPAELEALVADAEPALVFHDEDFAGVAAQLGVETVSLAALDGMRGRPPEGAKRHWEEPATLLYTSGTSGRPKGVILSERNAFFGCLNFVLGNDVGRDSVFLCDMPLFHTAGLFAAARVPLLGGGAVLVTRGFDPVKTLDRLGDPALAVTHYFSVPQMAQMLWQQPGFDPAKLRNIRYWATGGAPNPAAQIERFLDAGIAMSNGFGMSETGSNYGTPMDDPAKVIAKQGSCGLPYPFIETRIVGENGEDLPPGETGEVWLAGPSVTPGYWNRPEENEKAFVGRWFRTGDAGWVDEEGWLYVVDRRKDMYISGGENVYPAEVEAVLAELEAIAEAAVIGVPDARWGEVGRAYLIPRAGHAVDAGSVLAHCASRLAKFKVPVTVAIVETIPRTASGKVLKHVLRDLAKEEMGG
ncbi:MAG TPA: AMP-binding protein [Allosphingosinicella sp.]|nr:AMP-binding protein [Allosphingosinicella sp.]